MINVDVGQTLGRWLDNPLTSRLIIVLIGLTVIVIVAGLLRRTATRYIRDSGTRYQTRKVISFLGYLITVVFIALVFSDKLGGLTVALGVAGAGVAFALQEVIASVAGWIAVSFGGFYRVGDRIQLGGIKGDVIDIAVLRTTIMQIGEWVDGDQYNGRIVRVANSFVFKEPVYNYSGEFPFLWDEIIVQLDGDSDFHLARSLIEQVAEEVVGDYARLADTAWQPITRRYLIEKASVQPMVAMTFNIDAIHFTLRYVVDYKVRRSTKDRLYTRILEEIRATGGAVEVAAATLKIDEVPELRMSVQNKSVD